MRIPIVAAFVLLSVSVVAQTLEEGKQLLRYGRLVKAEEYFEKLVQANPNDPQANYWLGQLYLNNNPVKLNEAKELYSKALTATNQHPLILVGMGNVELLEKNNAAARQHFDQAIAATKNKKNKNFGDAEVLEAIGIANAMGDEKTGDIDYALEKLTQAEQLDPKNPHVNIAAGMIHLKRGGEYGGPAKSEFEKAIDKAPNYGRSYYRIGKIFESQRNTELFLQWYNRAVEKDPKFAPAYLSLYNYYENRDINKAKEYLDKFVANNDPDKETAFFQADYLFRAGKYQESLEKAKEIMAGLKPSEKFPKAYKLYSYNYDRLGDSVQARDYMEKYMKEQDPAELKGDDYADMATLYLKFPGMENKADELVDRAVALDTAVDNQIKYMQELAGAYQKAGNWEGTYKWLNRVDAINPNKTATTYYYLADAAYKAKQYQASADVAAKYIAAYPDQIQGYFLQKRAAVTADADTSLGTAIPAVDQYTQFMMKDTATYKGRIMENHSYKIYYYVLRSKEYEKAIEACDAILAIEPGNAYATRAKSEAERLLKATGGQRASSTSSQTASKPTGGSGN
jgi:tetratricopeptide (TPR) repeat protein